MGSGLYVDAYEALTEKLQDLGRKLVTKYEAMAGDRTIAGESIIREGNPVALLAREARRHDLVVMGHQPRSSQKKNERTRYLRYAVAEGLAEHWIHLRITNPIESTFATVRLRTVKTRGMLTRDTMLTMVLGCGDHPNEKWR